MCYRIKELCIKLVIETSLYYDVRSEKHQIISATVQYDRLVIHSGRFTPEQQALISTTQGDRRALVAERYNVVKSRNSVHANYRTLLLRSYKRILVTTPAETSSFPLFIIPDRQSCCLSFRKRLASCN
jgi:hypothetical protein